MNEKLLLVDDEAPFVRAVTLNLRAHGYDVEWATSAKEALEAASRLHPDVIILDLGLPGMDGFDLLSAFRAWLKVPIIILSARDAEATKIACLDAGADDYVTKPFAMGELLARVRAVLRRATPLDERPTVDVGDLHIDLVAKRVLRDGQEIRLTPTEWQLVSTLVRNRGCLVSQRQLLQEVWGPNYSTETNYLRVYMARIRHKLEPDPTRARYFITEPGMGYRFAAEQ
ncbi:MAG: response regulator [Actinobacteria bacterium]|jgi:two-component system KDP operon response regulator KdpE|nr:response regulator [Actinomycetota bacterium]MCL6094223.1 response regulator [Actinomycetota bacterium]